MNHWETPKNMALPEQSGLLISPDPTSNMTSSSVEAIDSFGKHSIIPIVTEYALTLFLNNREIVTLMSVGDYPKLLGVGYLVNQNMLLEDDVISEIEFDEELNLVVVRTERTTDYEDKLKRKVLTSGCGMGTVFGDIMDTFEETNLNHDTQIHASWVSPLLERIKKTPSLYQKAGAIHGCILCKKDQPFIYMEDVGRHNALDKIAGYLYLNQMDGQDYYIYTTGRMTSEMVIKAVSMKISILISRSGATHWAVELAKKAGLTLISRARGKRFNVLSAPDRVVFDLTEG